MQKLFKKIILILVLATVGGGIGYYYTHRTSSMQPQEQGPIYDYNEVRDKADIKQMFEDEKWWLLMGDYDVDFMLDYKAPHQDPLYVGSLHVKVLRENNQFIGFACYYKKTIAEGALLFLAIKKEFRKRGYACKLAQYVINDFAKMGIPKVTLVTRIQNIAGQATYNKLGFTEVGRNDVHVFYEISTKKPVTCTK